MSLPWLRNSARILSQYRGLSLRILILLLLLLVWEWAEWTLARRFTANLTTAVLSPFCSVWAAPDGGSIICDGTSFLLGKECTYLDLFLLTAPFFRRTGLGFASNLGRLWLLLSLIVLVNTGRLAVGVSAMAHGVGWQLAHDLPDLLLYWPFLAIVLFNYGSGLAYGPAKGARH